MEERFKEFTVLITQISRSIHKLKTEEMAGLNLKSSHVSCLYYLYKNDGMTTKELCDVCSEDKANISRSVKYLEENGYIITNLQKTKNYRAPLSLTPKGKDGGKVVAEKIDNVLHFAGLGLSDNERALMYSALSKINSNLEKICMNY